jgi:hypothetical protein
MTTSIHTLETWSEKALWIATVLHEINLVMENEATKTSNETLAMVLLVKAIFEQLDELAVLKKAGHQAKVSTMLMGEICSVLKDLDSAQQESYFSMLEKLSAHAEPATLRYSEEFSALTARSKRNFISKVRSDLKLKAA